MFRVAAATYLMLAQLAGPLLCCCSLLRAAPPVAPAPSSDQPAPVGSSCCGGHVARPAQKDAPQRPQPPDRRDCPCQQGPSRTTPYLSDQPEALKLLSERPEGLLYLASPILSSPCRVGQAAFLSHPEGMALPFLSADDILRAHHILRC
jgi:hypothetical protein